MKVLCILLCVVFASGFYIDNNGTQENKIFGGENVRIEDVPYQASVLWLRIDNFCGATIIHESWVVTAAHCVERRSHISVRTGSGYRETSGNEHRVQRIIKHDDYEKTIKDHDIALIKLAHPIHVNNEQRPIELAKPHDIPRERELMQISGFGDISEHPPIKTDVLKVAYVPVVNQENCERAYRLFPITENMFCAGNGDADMCLGDSGGPGVIHGKLYGIISTNSICGSRIFPGVYTRVHKCYDWIEEKTGLSFSNV